MLEAAGYRDFPFYGSRRGYIANVPCAFDIETSSFYSNGRKRGIMYIWMLGINGQTMVGRTWKEFEDVIAQISEILQLNDNRRLLIGVHNLAYEFQFMRKHFNFTKVFAVKERAPVYAITDSGIEFRCTLILSGYKLATIGTDILRKYKVEKLVGDLDYELIRNRETVMTDTELDYCLNDVKVVMAYLQEKIEADGNITRLQLTKTGYVRKYCRDACMYNGSHKKSTWKYLEYAKKMRNLTIDGAQEYRMLKRAFQGGFTHAQFGMADTVHENVKSQDFTSSYPAVMCMEKFPCSRGEWHTVDGEEDFRRSMKSYCCIFNIRFDGICARADAPDHPLSRSKCWQCKGRLMEDNGRIMYADEVSTTITEIDFAVLEKFYTWEHIEVGRMLRYRRQYLPREFVLAILKLYENKTILKGVEGREEEYMNSKEMLNSSYGMAVMDPCRPENVYEDDKWLPPAPPALDEALTKYNEDQRRFLFYPWGVYVTAYARRNLFTAIWELGPDYIYADTDSVKYVNYEAHNDYFMWYNDNVRKKLEKAMSFQKIPFEMCIPKTVKGKEKLLGAWDDEGVYSKFKTLGAKRYMTEKDSKLSITVSGVNKDFAVPYLLKTYEDPFEVFSNDLEFPEEATGKMTHSYLDEGCSGWVTDYQGHEAPYEELSFVHLEKCTYNLSMTDAYIRLLKGMVELPC